MNPESGPARWERGAAKVAAALRIFDVLSVHYRHPQRGRERDFVVIDAPDWVNVVALTPEGGLVLARQFRYGIDDFSLEIPGGVVERGEDPAAAGRRELAEETGFAGGRMRRLGSAQVNPAIQNNRCHFILAEGVERKGAPAWDPDEEIAIEIVPLEEALAWARDGRLTHSLTLCALWRFEALRRAGAV